MIYIGENPLTVFYHRFANHDHGMRMGLLKRKQQCVERKIIIYSNVWLGCDVVVLKGGMIANGAVIATGAVVSKLVPVNEIWGGMLVRKIGKR